MIIKSPYLAQRITYRREKLGLSHEELAERAGLSIDYIRAVEKGKRQLDARMIARFAVALDVPIEELNRMERYLWRD